MAGDTMPKGTGFSPTGAEIIFKSDPVNDNPYGSTP